MHSYVLTRTQRHLSSKIYSDSLLTIFRHTNCFLFVPNTYPDAYTYILTHIHVCSSHIYPYALCKLNLTSEWGLTSCKAPRSLFHILDIFRNDHNRWLCKTLPKHFTNLDQISISESGFSINLKNLNQTSASQLNLNLKS